MAKSTFRKKIVISRNMVGFALGVLTEHNISKRKCIELG